jgi:hypothetical protein
MYLKNISTLLSRLAEEAAGQIHLNAAGFRIALVAVHWPDFRRDVPCRLLGYNCEA